MISVETDISVHNGLSESVLFRYLGKLERHGALPLPDRQAFLSLPYTEESIAADKTVITKGSHVNKCIIVGKGLLSRVKNIENGIRQIVAFIIPHDAPDLQSLLLPAAVDDLYTHTVAQIVRISHADMREVILKHPSLAHALWQDTLIEASIFREWTVNVGQRRAGPRIAHLLLEMEARFAGAGKTLGTYALDLTQVELSQALALSLVHLNKSLQGLRKAGMIELKAGRVTILDRVALENICGFDPLYLHLGSPD